MTHKNTSTHIVRTHHTPHTAHHPHPPPLTSLSANKAAGRPCWLAALLAQALVAAPLELPFPPATAAPSEPSFSSRRRAASASLPLAGASEKRCHRPFISSHVTTQSLPAWRMMLLPSRPLAEVAAVAEAVGAGGWGSGAISAFRWTLAPPPSGSREVSGSSRCSNGGAVAACICIELDGAMSLSFGWWWWWWW